MKTAEELIKKLMKNQMDYNIFIKFNSKTAMEKTALTNLIRKAISDGYIQKTDGNLLKVTKEGRQYINKIEGKEEAPKAVKSVKVNINPSDAKLDSQIIAKAYNIKLNFDEELLKLADEINNNADFTNIEDDRIDFRNLKTITIDSETSKDLDDAFSIEKLDDNNYWAYTAWANSETIGDVNNPIPNLFGWASYDFMYAYYEEENINEIKIDSHTFIHETGHFLGLKDYYGENGYNPIGGADMMDRSIIDHNSYSKMLLGWSKPYLVYGAGQIDISSMDKENSFIVVLDDNAYDNNGQFNPFDEYILIELYTTEGLNNKDSTYTLSKNKHFKAPDEIGIRIYHVDKRVYFLDASSYNWTISLYDGQQLLPNTGLVTPITNSRAKGLYEIYFGLSSSVTLYDEIRLINKSGVDTFSSGGLADNNSLFKKGDVFSLEKYSKQFYDASFNNNNPFTKSIIVEDIYE